MKNNLCNEWKTEKLKIVADVVMGQSPPSSTYNNKKIGLPFFQGKAEFGKIYPTATKYCSKPIRVAKKDDILMSVRAPVGPVNLSPGECCFGRGLCAIRAKNEILNQSYLFFFLRSIEKILSNQGQGSTFGAIGRDDIEEINIPYPTDKENQKQIVAILEKAEKLKEMRGEANRLTKDFLRAAFLEIFGDPVKNNKKWESKPFDYFATIDTKMTNDFSKYEDKPLIGIENIERDTGELINYHKVGEQKIISGKYIFTKKHVIYSKIRPNLNKVALPNFDGLCSADAYPILINEETSNRHFFAFILRSELFLNHILKHSRRANIPKANKDQIRSFYCINPPVGLQKKFGIIVESINVLNKHQKQSGDHIHNLFNNLMQKAFNGELAC